MNIPETMKSIITRNVLMQLILKPIIGIHRKVKTIKKKRYLRQFNEIYEKIFSRVLPSSVLVKLDEFQGVFELDIRSDIFGTIALHGSFEKDLIDKLSQYIDKRKDAVDIGSNVGFFSIYLAKSINKDCKVLSIEPTPNAFSFLKRNVERNNCEVKTILYNGALSDNKNKKVSLNTIDGKEEYSSFGKIDLKYAKNHKISQIEVECTTLDDLIYQNKINPGIIKIDTEGAEFLIIKGSLQTIQKFNPIIISELCDDFLKKMGHSAKDLIELLKSNNYRVINAKTLIEDIAYPFNGEIIAIPNK